MCSCPAGFPSGVLRVVGDKLLVDVCQLPHMGVLTDVVNVHIVARELHVILSLPCTALGIFVASCGSQYLWGIITLLSALNCSLGEVYERATEIWPSAPNLWLSPGHT